MTDTILTLPLALIVVDPTKNCRRELGSIDDLVEATELLHPVTVRPRDDGLYDLIAGYRRVAAAAQKGEGAILARVWHGDELERAVVNLRENLDRRSLTTWETAAACQRLQVEHGLTPAQIVERTGLHIATVNNHLRCLRLLESSIQREWERGHPAATVDFLRELAVLPHDQQLDRWNERVGRTLPRPPITRPAAAAAAAPQRRRSTRELERAVQRLEKADESPDWRRGAAEALEFALGRASGLGSYRPRGTRRAPRTARGKGDNDAGNSSAGGLLAASAV